MNFIRNSFTRQGSSKKDLDFDEEARALWARLNLDHNNRNSGYWNATDPIWKHPSGNGIIYVGNQTAAESLSTLRGLGISRVVNCTYGYSKIPNFHEGTLKYYNFPISHWQSFVNESHKSVIEFVKPLFEFMDEAVANGESVLVHCLAGAHRAGTTGCACLIYFAGMNVDEAIRTAKRCRPIIDPIGQLPEFLRRLYGAYLTLGGAPAYHSYKLPLQTTLSTSSSNTLSTTANSTSTSSNSHSDKVTTTTTTTTTNTTNNDNGSNKSGGDTMRMDMDNHLPTNNDNDKSSATATMEVTLAVEPVVLLENTK